MVVDIIIIILLLAFVGIGIARGLIGSLVSVFSVIIALVVALIAYKPVGNAVYVNTNIGETIKQTIVKNIPLNDTDMTLSKEDTSLPDVIVDSINEKMTVMNETKNQAINDVSEEIAKNIINVVVFVIIFLVVRGILLLIKILTKLIDKLPIIGHLDKFGGGVCGFVEGAFIIYAIFAILSITSPMINNESLLKSIDSSYIGSFMYNHNLIINKIKK